MTQSAAVGDNISIVAGNPSIVIRDRFAVETPKAVIRSNSGEFELQVFDDYYRVIDVHTGELLQERAGWSPNFSPSSRFLGAHSASLPNFFDDTILVHRCRQGAIDPINLRPLSFKASPQCHLLARTEPPVMSVVRSQTEADRTWPGQPNLVEMTLNGPRAGLV